LAAVDASLGDDTNALAQLKTAMDLNAARLKTNSSAFDLLPEARKDPHLNSLRQSPEFQKIVPAQ
jgi:hypothetical protein